MPPLLATHALAHRRPAVPIQALKTLYITSCSQDFGELATEPLPSPAGALFAAEIPFTAGLPEPEFGG